MIRYLSKGLADKLYENEIVTLEDLEIYRCGAEIIISSALGIFMVIMLGVILGKIKAAIAFLAVFIPVRTYTGGYHASSYTRCTICTCSVFVLMVILCETIFVRIGVFVVGISSACSLYVIAQYSPIENEKKRLKQEQKKRNKYIAVCLAIVVIVLSIVAFVWNKEVGYYLSATLFMVGVLMVISLKWR